jgi:hypothetical protein
LGAPFALEQGVAFTEVTALPQPRLGWLRLGGEPRCTEQKDPQLGYWLFPNQGLVGVIQVVG